MLGQPFKRTLRSVPHSPFFSHLPFSSPLSRTIQAAPPSRFVSQCASAKPSQPAFTRIPSQKPRDRCPPVLLLAKNFPGSRRSFSSQRFQYDQYNRFRGAHPIFQRLRSVKLKYWVMSGVVISGFYIYNLEEVEMTGRRRFNCVSYQTELKMGAQNYREILKSTRGRVLPENHPLSQMVGRVMQRLIPLAPIEGADWKVHVIKDDGMVNAFVLPGGKVFVYTGILPICQNEDGLAAVLGHEIAHVVAHHPGERMSNNILSVVAVYVISFVFDVSGNLPSLLLNIMYGLPNSRTQEAEADNIGLTMMSKACFNPEAALKFWGRMQKWEKEQPRPPQFLSTHPSSYNRMEAIRGWLVKAEAIYEDSGCHAMRQYMPAFREAYTSQDTDG